MWPLLNIQRQVGFRPIKTYVLDTFKTLTEQDCCLIAPFSKDPSKNFGTFEEQILLTNEYFYDFYEGQNSLVYIFDLKPLQDDFERFIEGRYSKLSKEAKMLINRFYGTQTGLTFKPHRQVNAYLNPTREVYQRVADEIGTSVEYLLGKEIIDKPDLDKETFDESKIIEGISDTQVPN